METETISLSHIPICHKVHYGDKWIWRVDGYICQNIASLAANIVVPNKDEPFLDIQIGEVDAANEVSYLQFFSKIGPLTRFLKISSKKTKSKIPSSLLSCFPLLKTLEIEKIDDLRYVYNEIPSTIITFNLDSSKTFEPVGQVVKKEVLEKLKKLFNELPSSSETVPAGKKIELQKILYSDLFLADTLENNIEDGTENGLLFQLTNELQQLLLVDMQLGISSSTSLLGATIKPSDILNLEYNDAKNENRDISELLRKLKNLKHLTFQKWESDSAICFYIHGVQWPELQSLILQRPVRNISDKFCERCFETIMDNFKDLKKLELPGCMEEEQLHLICQKFSGVTDFTLNLLKDRNGAELTVLQHFDQLKKLTVDFNSENDSEISIETLRNIPSLSQLEEFTLGSSAESHNFSLHVENHICSKWKESVFCELAQKFPKLKKLECSVVNFTRHDLFAALISWTDIESLKIADYTSHAQGFNSLEFLREQKNQGWSLPSLKVFKYESMYDGAPINEDESMDEDEGVVINEDDDESMDEDDNESVDEDILTNAQKSVRLSDGFFRLFPSLKYFWYTNGNDIDACCHLADYQKRYSYC